MKRPLQEGPSQNERWCTNVASVTRRHGLLPIGIRAKAAASRLSSSLLAFMSMSAKAVYSLGVVAKVFSTKKDHLKLPQVLRRESDKSGFGLDIASGN